jgi:hypothetical protein
VLSPPFHDLIMLLEDISKRRSEKSQLLRKYFKVMSMLYVVLNRKHCEYLAMNTYLYSIRLMLDFFRNGARTDTVACFRPSGYCCPRFVIGFSVSIVGPPSSIMWSAC